MAKIAKSPECITPSAFDHDRRKQPAKVGVFNLIATMYVFVFVCMYLCMIKILMFVKINIDINIRIGGGVLSLPFAVAKCGIVLGLIFLFLSALASLFSFDVLISASRRTGAMTYQQIGMLFE